MAAFFFVAFLAGFLVVILRAGFLEAVLVAFRFVVAFLTAFFLVAFLALPVDFLVAVGFLAAFFVAVFVAFFFTVDLALPAAFLVAVRFLAAFHFVAFVADFSAALRVAFFAPFSFVPSAGALATGALFAEPPPGQVTEVRRTVDLVHDLPSQHGLHHVLERGHARDSTELVHHGKEVRPRLQEPFEELMAPNAVGYEVQGARQFTQRDLPAAFGQGDQYVGGTDGTGPPFGVVGRVYRYPENCQSRTTSRSSSTRVVSLSLKTTRRAS